MTILRWEFRRLALVAVSLMLFGCTADLSRSSIEYDSGRINLDWPDEGQLNDDEILTFERNIEHDIDLLRAKLQDRSIVAALRAANAKSSELTLGDILELDHHERSKRSD